MAISVIFIGRCMGESIMTLIVQVCVGALIYAVLILLILLLTKDEDIRKIISGLKSFIKKKVKK